MRRFIINNLFFIRFLLIYLNPNRVLSKTEINPKSIGFDNKTRETCVLTEFKASVIIKPSNDQYIDITFKDLSPNTSDFKFTKCDDKRIQHYYRFDDFNTTSTIQSTLSFGVELQFDIPIEIHISYLQINCSKPNGCLRENPKYCKNPSNSLNCLRMSATYDLGWTKRGYSYECSHNWRMNFKDTVYIDDLAVFRGTISVDLDFIRVDLTNSTDSFHPNKYCFWDWILSTNSIIITSVVVCVIISLLVFKCLFDLIQKCRKSSDIESESFSLKNNDSKEQNEEECGPPVDL